MRNQLCLLSLVLGCFCMAEDVPEFRASPLTEVQVLPERRWKPDETEAKPWRGPLAKLLRTMLEAGLPDPAGLPYHRIGIGTGNCYTGDSGITITEGWILPGGEKQPRFAIAWNGLVYPVAEDRGVADLKATVARLMKVGEEDRAAWHDTEEPTRVDPLSLSLIHGLYLTRLGFPEAAEHVLAKRETALKSPPVADELAMEWIWSHYERAVCAHMRGDPKLVLAAVDGYRRASAALAKTLQSVDPMFGVPNRWNDDLVALARENKRRLKENKTGLLDEKSFVAGKPSTKALIDALDRIQMPQSGQPGDVPLWESPVVKALAAKGNEAVEPLLECLEHDERLTQSVHFWRAHHKSRTILGVHEAALYALEDILATNFFKLASTGDSLTARERRWRTEIAAAMRANWEKYGRTSGPSRSYAVLKDDQAGAEAWIAAAGALLHKEEYDEETGKVIPPKGPLPGEELRSRKNPTVTDLLARRIAETAVVAGDDERDARWNLTDMLAILVEWDLERGRVAVARQTREWLNHRAWRKDGGASCLQAFIAEVVDQVPDVLPLFEAMAWDPSASAADNAAAFVSRVMAAHGNDPRMKHKPDEIWQDPESPWCLAVLDHSDLRDLIQCWKEQGLTRRKPFRAVLLRVLADHGQCGTAGMLQDKPGEWYLDLRHGTITSPKPDDPKFALKPGEVTAVRRMDVAARTLVESPYLEQNPPRVLEYYWSEAERDAWVSAVVKKLGSDREDR